MGFLSELISDFTSSGKQDQQQQQQSGYGQYPPQQQQQGYSQYPPPQHSQQPPPVSPPWYAEWDQRENRWIFVNQQNGERTYQYPGPGYAQQQGNYGAPPPQGGYGYGQDGYSNQGAYQQSAYDPTRSGQQQEEKSGGNGWKYAAAGVAGVAGGALLMHESDKIEDGWDSAKANVSNGVDEFGNDVSNFPENAAGWTGEQVGRAENFGDDVEQKWDNGVQDVEDFPENAAEWTGEKVQAVEDIPEDIENKWDNMTEGVEQFGDNMENAYDEGRDEQRYDDEY
ncbi:uncharacterized protein J4E92_007339 [Alternaria infectoria]|uniref:uncharacterized protein n=1 Tax=Alternaria infectoria TaxID=45303 RepID=UPI00221EB7D6|nr:uncharacterized protein J4E92_007339 [Alternaria infectoria]KAI4924258.1 hypothetical protein J4E92_007339 [Alternaria infectoria]